MVKFKGTLVKHIERLYTIDEIFDLYETGNYNAELLLQHCLINIEKLSTFPGEQVMDKETEKKIKWGIIKAKDDEVYYLNQVFKNLKYLEHIYKAGKLEDEDKAFHVEINLKTTSRQIDKLKKELIELYGDTDYEEWRTFDQS